LGRHKTLPNATYFVRLLRSSRNHGDTLLHAAIQLAAKKPLYKSISFSFVFDNNHMKIKDNILLAYTLL